MTSAWLASARRGLRRLLERHRGPPVLRNVFQRDPARHHRRALLSYLVRPFQVASLESPEFRSHAQGWQNRAIANLLDGRGYRVDVIHYSDDRFVPTQPYDLLLGMGPACIRIARWLGSAGTKIYINTGAESTFNNRQEMARLADLQRRRNRSLKPRRLTKMDPGAFACFDALTCFGNGHTASLFRPYHDRVYPFNNCGVSGISFRPKDYALARKSFLYLSSHGQVHKGLDLLLEAFAGLPDCTLLVCTSLKREWDFVRCYWRELFRLPNIRFLGWIEVGGERFNQLCLSANASVCASCAEGQVGAIVDCMHAGLIPVITRECGIDTEGVGWALTSCGVPELRASLERVAGMPAAWHAEQSRRVSETARREYSGEAFIARWNQILDEVLGRNLLAKGAG